MASDSRPMQMKQDVPKVIDYAPKSSPGYMGWKWLRDSQYRKKVAYPFVVFVILLLFSYLAPIWPFWLLAELGAVALGVTAGWCGLDFQRMKVTSVAEQMKVKG